MEFNSSEADPWRPDYISRQLRVLGAERPTVSAEAAAGLRGCYENPYRSYHDELHGNFMGQEDLPEALRSALSPDAREWAGAAVALAGLWHDALQEPIDAQPNSAIGAWHDYIIELIGNYATCERTVENDRPIFRTYLTEAGMYDPTMTMVAQIFGFDEQKLSQGIMHNQGGKEFGSALAAAKFLAIEGTPLHKIVAVTACIAGTVPFRPARGNAFDDAPDGDMGELAQRVEAVLRSSSEQNAWAMTNDIMLLTVHLANRDISQFIEPDGFAEFINGGRKVKKEEVPELRALLEPGLKITMEELVRIASLERSAPLLYQWIGSGEGAVKAADVPHFYLPRDEQGRPQLGESYPSQPVYEQAARHAANNTNLATLFFQAHEAGIVFAYCLACLLGEADAEVPGFVDANAWRDIDQPVRQAGAQFTDREQAVCMTLLHGIRQEHVDEATSMRSPIAGTLLAALGANGIHELSGKIQHIRREQGATGHTNAFANPVIADAVTSAIVQGIGQQNFNLIVGELQHVARTVAKNPARATRLGQLLTHYSTGQR